MFFLFLLFLFSSFFFFLLLTHVSLVFQGAFLLLVGLFERKLWALIVLGPVVPVIIYQATAACTEPERLRRIWLSEQVFRRRRRR